VLVVLVAPQQQDLELKVLTQYLAQLPLLEVVGGRQILVVMEALVVAQAEQMV
jgi:hypothetical protein